MKKMCFICFNYKRLQANTMPVHMKTLVQYGSSTAHVLTVELPGSAMATRKQNILNLAGMALTASLQSGNINVNGYAETLRHVSRLLKDCSRLQGKHMNNVHKSESTQADVRAHSSLAVRGVSAALSPAFLTSAKHGMNAQVVYGNALLLVENKKLETKIPALHVSTTFNGVDVGMTFILQQTPYHRECQHFICTDDGIYKNLADVSNLARADFRMAWPPFMSHYLSRKQSTNMHIQSFSNDLLSGSALQDTQHTVTPLFDYVKSKSKSVSESNPFTCISTFV